MQKKNESWFYDLFNAHVADLEIQELDLIPKLSQWDLIVKVDE